MHQKGHVALLPLIIIILVAIGAVVFVSINGQAPSSITQLLQRETPQPAQTTLTDQYQNPFDKNTQYGTKSADRIKIIK